MKRILSAFLALLFSFSLFSTVNAANVCGNIYGNANSAKSFTINTGKRWLGSDKVTFTQTKGTYEYSTPFSRSKTASGYMGYKVKYRKQGTSSWKTATWKGKTLTLKLSKNTVYDVTVTPFNKAEMAFEMGGKNIKRWKSVATWSVTSTKGIISCG